MYNSILYVYGLTKIKTIELQIIGPLTIYRWIGIVVFESVNVGMALVHLTLNYYASGMNYIYKRQMENQPLSKTQKKQSNMQFGKNLKH